MVSIKLDHNIIVIVIANEEPKRVITHLTIDDLSKITSQTVERCSLH